MLRRIILLPLLSTLALSISTSLLAQEMTPAELTAEVRSLKSQLQKLSGNVTESIGQVGDLKRDLIEVTSKVNEELRKQQQILDAIADRDTAGKYIPRLSAAMESDKFRADMDNAVHKVIHPTGTFEVTNKTSNYERILINQTEFGVDPGQKIVVNVPVGTVTTRVRGRDKETWTVTAPNYRQGIDIVPATYTSFFGSTVYVARPTYYPPIYSTY